MKPLDKIVFRLLCHQYADETQLYLTLSDPSWWWALIEFLVKFHLCWMGSYCSWKLVCGLEVSLDIQIASSRDQEPSLSYWFIWLPWPFLGRRDLTTVTYVLVTSRLKYCNVLYVGLFLKIAWKLQLLQNATSCLLTGAKSSSHITPVFRNSIGSQLLSMSGSKCWLSPIKPYLAWDWTWSAIKTFRLGPSPRAHLDWLTGEHQGEGLLCSCATVLELHSQGSLARSGFFGGRINLKLCRQAFSFPHPLLLFSAALANEWNILIILTFVSCLDSHIAVKDGI